MIFMKYSIYFLLISTNIYDWRTFPANNLWLKKQTPQIFPLLEGLGSRLFESACLQSRVSILLSRETSFCFKLGTVVCFHCHQRNIDQANALFVIPWMYQYCYWIFSRNSWKYFPPSACFHNRCIRGKHVFVVVFVFFSQHMLPR